MTATARAALFNMRRKKGLCLNSTVRIVPGAWPVAKAETRAINPRAFSRARTRGCPQAAFDVVDAECIKPLGDAQFVSDRERDGPGLRDVAQSGVVDFDVRAHLIVFLLYWSTEERL